MPKFQTVCVVQLLYSEIYDQKRIKIFNTALKHFRSFVWLDKQIYKLNISFETFEKLKKGSN